MKNFKVTSKEDGKEYWISRHMAVTGIIRVIHILPPSNPETPEENPEIKIYYLLSKRGEGCPDHVGKWQCNCGYLDFDETLADAVIREIKEELGLDLGEAMRSGNVMSTGEPKVLNFSLLAIRDLPEHDPRQNVTFRYLIDVNYNWIKELTENGTINGRTEERGGEKNEIEEIRLVPWIEIEKDPYTGNFAFNHEDMLRELNSSPENSQNEGTKEE